jgi:hypothetical protein
MSQRPRRPAYPSIADVYNDIHCGLKKKYIIIIMLDRQGPRIFKDFKITLKGADSRDKMIS